MFATAIVGAIGVGLYGSDGPGLALLGVVFLLVTLGSFFFPTRYRVDEEGVEMRNLGVPWRRRFEELKRLEEDPRGVFLSPFAEPKRLEEFRGLYLRCPEALRERLLAALRTRIGAD